MLTRGLAPVTLGDFNFSTGISHRRRAPTLIYGLGPTERVSGGRVAGREGFQLSLTREPGMIVTDMMRSCELNQLRMCLAPVLPDLLYIFLPPWPR